jgi:hypothetical protein
VLRHETSVSPDRGKLLCYTATRADHSASRRQVNHPKPQPHVPGRTRPKSRDGAGSRAGTACLPFDDSARTKTSRPFAADVKYGRPVDANRLASEPGLEGWGHLSRGRRSVARGPLGHRTPSHPNAPTRSAQRRAVPGEAEPARRASPSTGARARADHSASRRQVSYPSPSASPSPTVPDGQARKAGMGLVLGLGRLACRSTTAFGRKRASPFAMDLKYGRPVDANRLAERAGARRLGALVVREKVCCARPTRTQNA